MEEVDGIWRTIRRHRIFIKTGQNLSDAIKESLDERKNSYRKKNMDTSQKKLSLIPLSIKTTMDFLF